MSQAKRFDVQRKFERRMDFIFGGRISDDGLKQAIEEDEKRAEAVSDDFLAVRH